MKKPNLISQLLLITIASAVLVIASVLTINQTWHIASAQNLSTSATPSSSNGTGAIKEVQAGGGNSTLPYDVFYPKQIQVSPGQSVGWYNPAKVAEPHTVTFVVE
jgi:plastocyanin